VIDGGVALVLEFNVDVVFLVEQEPETVVQEITDGIVDFRRSKHTKLEFELDENFLNLLLGVKSGTVF